MKYAVAPSRRIGRASKSLVNWLAAPVAFAVASPASSQTIFPNVPDFYQHENWLQQNVAVPFWETANYNKTTGARTIGPGGGWCWQTAVVDSLYKWNVYTAPGGGQPYNTLLYPGISANATWLSASSFGIAFYAGVVGGSINNLLNTTQKFALNPAGTPIGPNAAQGATPTASLTDTSYVVGSVTGTVGVFLAGKTAPETVTEAGAVPALTDPNSTIYQVYKEMMNANHSTVITIRNTYAGQNGLWWAGGTSAGNFHTLSGAGYNGVGATGQIIYSVPDSVPPNAGNFDGGWTNAAVTANEYAAGAAGPPIGAGYYGNMMVNAQASITSSVATTTKPNGNYQGVRISNLDAIAPTDLGLTSSVLQGNGSYQDTFRVIGDVSGDISQIDIFPVVPLYATDPGFSFSKANWTTSTIISDPYRGAWAGGGENISAGLTGVNMTAGEVQTDTMFTTAQVTAFNVFEYDDTLDEWIVQSYGANQNAFGFQLEPEPSPLLLMGMGSFGAGIFAAARRRRT